MSEHTWLQYVGAYKNLFKMEDPDGGELEGLRPLAGKTKLTRTQVIDAAHILNLIDGKVQISGGVQTVDNETLRIIYEQIQELSNMGEDKQAQLLKDFVDTELVPGKLSSEYSFDMSFEKWKNDKLRDAVRVFAEKWGIDELLLLHSVETYSETKPDIIPNIDDIVKSADYDKAGDQSAGNTLVHVMNLTDELPRWMANVRTEYK
jgi:type I restriction enzyme R subunit